jgi:hypothetical protein
MRLDGDKDILTPATIKAHDIKNFTFPPRFLFVHSFNLFFSSIDAFARFNQQAIAISTSNTAGVNSALALSIRWRVERPTSGYNPLTSLEGA